MSDKTHEIIKWAFVYCTVLLGCTAMFTVGLLTGQFGTGNLKAVLFVLLPLALFWLGYFTGKYKKYNPL